MSVLELEHAIRQLPPIEAKKLLELLRDVAGDTDEKASPLNDSVIKKWQVTEGWPAGLTTAEYLHAIRGGNRS